MLGKVTISAEYYCLTSSPSVTYTGSEHVVKISALSQVSVALCSCMYAHKHKNNKITYRDHTIRREIDKSCMCHI